jgi:outer membrane protein assembly factor BamB
MKARGAAVIAGVGTALLWVGCLAWWLTRVPALQPELSTPYRDGKPRHLWAEGGEASGETVRIGEFFEAADGVEVPLLPGDWPRFKGALFDHISRETVPLAESWGPDGPPRLWTVEVGEGHAGPIVRNGRIYLLDYDEERGGDALRCLALADGREVWRRWYRVEVKRNHGMSRSVPAIEDGVVVSIGPKAHVMAVDAVSGDLLWSIDMQRRYASRIPGWYTAQCPLIDDGRVILAPSGKTVLMTAVDLKTGAVAWEAGNLGGFDLSHSSVIPMECQGVRLYVYAGIGGLAGVDAASGRVLWVNTEWHPAVVAPSPVPLADGRIFMTAGYGAGSALFELSAAGGTWAAELVERTAPDEGLASEQQTPIWFRGHLFGILPKDAGPDRQQFVCVSGTDIRTFAWQSGKTHRFGLGPYIIADGKFFVLDDDGTLSMLRASEQGYTPLASATILDGHDAWGPMAIAGGRLLLRDATRLVCVDLRKEAMRGE